MMATGDYDPYAALRVPGNSNFRPEDTLPVGPNLPPTESGEFWRAYRQGLLMLVDVIERKMLHLPVTTSDIRKAYKNSGRHCE